MIKNIYSIPTVTDRHYSVDDIADFFACPRNYPQSMGASTGLTIYYVTQYSAHP